MSNQKHSAKAGQFQFDKVLTVSPNGLRANAKFG